ncbi:MAG: YlxR family protein [Candidatus Cybelea sp.]
MGCRRRFAQRELVRFVKSVAGWQADGSRRKQPGRGAYLCSATCAERARKNKRYPGLGTAAAEYGLIESPCKK